MNTQAQRLLQHLQTGHDVTRLSALTELSIFELSARCIDLERLGYTIHRERITVTNRYDEKVSVCRYWMDEQKVAA